MLAWARAQVLAVALLTAALGGCAIVDRLDGMAQAQQLHETGVLAEARVLRVWDTGMSVNGDPIVGILLEIHPRDAETYKAETKQLVSRLEIPQIQPGAVLAVRYDPTDCARVSLDPLAIAAASLPMPAPTSLPRAADIMVEKRRLLATGVVGSVTLLRCQPLGLFDADGRPVWDLVFTVEVPERSPFVGPARVGVPPEHERWFRVGQRLPIRADPNQPERFAVDWDALGK